MTVSNKTKTIATVTNINKGIGAEWDDPIATWDDAFFGWADIEIVSNKSKSVVLITNKPKVNV